MQTAKAQISLRIRAVLTERLLFGKKHDLFRLKFIMYSVDKPWSNFVDERLKKGGNSSIKQAIAALVKLKPV